MERRSRTKWVNGRRASFTVGRKIAAPALGEARVATPVTYAHQRGASDRAIAHQTRHRSLATVGTYIRIDNAWEDNSAALLAGL